MTLKKRKAEQIVTWLEQPINLHLLKLLGCQADAALRPHWKRELSTWLFRIASITIKPDNVPIPAKLACKWLYDETFGGSELRNVEMTLQFLARDYHRNDILTADISQRFQQIHRDLAQRIARNDTGEDIIEAL